MSSLIHQVTVLTMITTITLCLLLITPPTHSERLTALAMKPFFKGAPFPDKTVNFYDFVQRCDYFIDKSLLIPRLLNLNESMVSITCPRKWGKSTNLGMFARFLNTEYFQGVLIPHNKSKNYQLFVHGRLFHDFGNCELRKPLLISGEKEFIDQHLGKYAVITLNLGAIGGRKYLDLVQSLAYQIVNAYIEHDYLVTYFSDIISNRTGYRDVKNRADGYNKIFFDYIYERKLTERAIPNSIKNLAEAIYFCFGKRPYLVIDEYDTIVNKIFLRHDIKEKDRSKFLDLYALFCEKTFQSNNTFQRVYISGITPLNYQDFSFKSNIKHYHCLQKELYPFYGFTRADIDDISQMLGIPDGKNNHIFETYGGFFIRDSDIDMYQPRAITDFINSKELNAYWWEITYGEKILKICLRFDAFKEKINQLLDNDGTDVHLMSLVITKKEMKRVELTLNNDKLYMNNEIILISLKFLYFWGYLTLNSTQTQNTYFMKFPNSEVVKKRLNEGLYRYVVTTTRKH